jgi:hypothetical protein
MKRNIRPASGHLGHAHVRDVLTGEATPQRFPPDTAVAWFLSLIPDSECETEIEKEW